MSNLRTAAAELIESLKDPSDLFRINKAIGNVNTALSDLFECPKCHETNAECRCLRGKCDICGKPLGKITYTFCDECWETEPQQTVSRENRHTGKLYSLTQEELKEIYEIGIKEGEDRSSSFEWGQRRKDVEFEENTDISLPSPIEGKVKAEAVKLPRRMYNPFNQETTYNSAWNACIEELKKLNPNANFITE